LIVVSGPSGVGKTTVVRRLCGRPGLERVITVTTREPRPHEIDGKDYHFRTPEEFEKGEREGRFLETATIFGNRYGTPKSSILDPVAAGKCVVADIDSQGARSVRDMEVDAVFFLIAPPSLEELERRLKGRKTETPENVARRLEAARNELAQEDLYDVVVVNETVDRTVERIVGELKSRGIICKEGD
jgi:guanylate kinase